MIFKSKQVNPDANARESVFDPTSGKYAAEIVGQFIETEDKEQIEALTRLGYEMVEKKESISPEEIKPAIIPPVVEHSKKAKR